MDERGESPTEVAAKKEWASQMSDHVHFAGHQEDSHFCSWRLSVTAAAQGRDKPEMPKHIEVNCFAAGFIWNNRLQSIRKTSSLNYDSFREQAIAQVILATRIACAMAMLQQDRSSLVE